MNIPVILFIIFSLIVILITGKWDFVVAHTFPQSTWGLYSKDFFENVLVEAHGAVIDLFVVGVVLFWFEKKREKADAIKSNLTLLTDLKLYRGPDASYRVLNAMKRLLELNVKSLSLPEASLNDIEISDIKLEKSNLRAANFTNTKLRQITLENCECDAAIFAGASFEHVTMRDVKLRRTKFHNAKLNGIDFSKCQIEMADFTNAKLRSANFSGVNCRGVKFKGADLRSANFLGATNLDLNALKEAKDCKHVKFDHVIDTE